MESAVIPFPDQRRSIVDRVRRLAEDSIDIHWSRHALERMDDREISMRQAIETLRRGELVEDPMREDYGEWSIILAKRHAGRTIQVVAVITESDGLIVKTVM